MELDQKQFDMIMTELKRFDTIEKDIKDIKEEQKQMKKAQIKINEKQEQLNKTQEQLNEKQEQLNKKQEQLNKKQEQIKETQEKMIVQMIKSFGEINKKLEDNIAVVQRQINENNLKEERRYQEQHNLNERLEASVTRLDDLSIQNLNQHDTYDEILHIERKPQCV